VVFAGVGSAAKDGRERAITVMTKSVNLSMTCLQTW
jgi:hypothetical protein